MKITRTANCNFLTTPAAIKAIAQVNRSQSNSTRNIPWTGWSGWALSLLFVMMLVCVIFDREATKILNVLAWLTLVIAAITDRHARWKHVIPTLIAFAAIVGSTWAAAWYGGDFPAAMHAFVKYQIGVIWLVVLWLTVPVMLHPLWRNRSTPEDCRCANRWAFALAATLLLFAWHVTISAAASMFPKDSMELLGSEVLPYTGLFIIIKRSAWCIHERWWYTGARVMWLVTAVASIGMAAVAVAALVSPAWGDTLFHLGYFRVDSYAPDTRRLQFLFQHHNRAGFFAACAIFICMAGAWKGKGWRLLGIIGAASAALALPFTLTRGAMVAAAAGMALFATAGLARNRRGRWALLICVVVALPLIWFMLPPKYQGHIAKIANPANYHESAGGSIGARLVMWDVALDMIERRPALGFGYGFENFESAAKADHPNKPEYFEGASHAHNHWLETAAETGLPGFVLLFLLTILRMGGLAQAWWKSSRQGYPLAWLMLLWLCLECVIQLYGLTNYTLRRNLGYLTYWIWAGSVALVIVAARERTREPEELPRF